MLKEFIDDLRRHGIAVFDLIQAGAGNHIFFARRNGHTWGIRISRRRGEHRYTVHIFSEESDLNEIYRFTDEKLRGVSNKDDPNAEFDIAFLNRAALERHGYDVATITDSDLQELAGRNGRRSTLSLQSGASTTRPSP